MARSSTDQKRRQGRGNYFLYSFSGTVTRPIRREDGDELVSLGKATRCYYPDGTWVGYKICEIAPEPSARPSALMITPHEMQLVAGTAFAGGKSRTACLDEAGKRERALTLTAKRGCVVAEEDAVERALAKVAGFGHGRVVCVQPAV